MPIFRSIGFGIFIIILSLMLPDVLEAGRETIIAFLHGARISADTASSIVANASSATAPQSSSLLPPLVYPQAASIPIY